MYLFMPEWYAIVDVSLLSFFFYRIIFRTMLICNITSHLKSYLQIKKWNVKREKPTDITLKKI